MTKREQLVEKLADTMDPENAKAFVDEVFQEADDITLKVLSNSGIDTKCGACMEIAFSGVTVNAHTCAFSKHRVKVTKR